MNRTHDFTERQQTQEFSFQVMPEPCDYRFQFLHRLRVDTVLNNLEPVIPEPRDDCQPSTPAETYHLKRLGPARLR